MRANGPIFSWLIVLVACCTVMQAQAAAYTLTIVASHGSVTVTPDKAQYEEGDTVELIPRPEVGYCFSHWSGDLRGKRLVGRITMNSNKSITANFGTWTPPIGIPMPDFGVFETYRMYDDPANRNGDLTYTQNAEGGYYTHWVEYAHPDSTDSSTSSGIADYTDYSNPGTPSKPRKTIPLHLPEGSVVELHGGPNLWHTGGGAVIITGAGTPQKPIFVRGADPDNRSVIAGSTVYIGWDGQTTSFLVFENVNVDNGDAGGITEIGLQMRFAADHIAIRNVDVTGDESKAPGVAMWLGSYITDPQPTIHDVFISGCYISGFGDMDTDYDADNYGAGFGAYVSNVWFVDNHITATQGGVICNSVGDPLNTMQNQSLHRVYVGRNVIHNFLQAGTWIKTGKDVIFSENDIYDSYISANDDGTQGIGTSCAAGYQLGPYSTWFLFNRWHDLHSMNSHVNGGIAFASGSTDAGDYVYLIGNEISNVSSNAILQWNSKPKVYLIGNTIRNVGSGITTLMDMSSGVELYNNIVSDVVDPNYHLDIQTCTDAARLSHCLFYEPGESPRLRWGERNLHTITQLQGETGQFSSCLDTDPKFSEVSDEGCHLSSSSPAIDAGLSSGVVQTVLNTFESRFGVSIEIDIERRSRPQSSAWDIGAYEYVLEPIEDLAVSGVSQNSVTVGWTIPGADGSSDRPGRYDIRYATSAITEANWDAATQVQGEPVPADVGDSQSFTISGLNPGTTYYIGIKTSNTGGTTISDLSNIASAATASSGNRAPVFQTIGDKAVAENATLTFTVGASDADGDTLTYSASGVPTGASFTPATRVFTWTPTNTQGGTHWVTFGVTDGQIPVTQTIAITVAEVVNNAPVLAAIGNKNVNEGSLLSFSISATDSDGDSLTYSATGLPSGANFTGQTFTWVPTYEQAGTYSVTFTVTDGELTDSEPITITVANVTPDLTAPTAAASYPAADAIQVPVNPVISLTVSDAGQGVDAGTVTIRVNDQLVYSGNAASYQSVYGVCRRTGTQASYRYAYQPAEAFRFDQQVSVRVTASDLAGNAMTPYNCSFTTEMRVFGDNRPASWAPDDADKTSPATVRDSAGNIWLAYHAGAAGERDIYISKLTAGNANFAGPIQLTTDSSDQCFPAIAIGSDDTLYVVWQDRRRGNWDIYIRTSGDGLTWSAETRITDSDDNQIRPAIAVDSQSPNRACVAWQDDDAGNQDIYIATSSNAFSTKTITQVTTNASDQTDPAIAIDVSNTVYLVWTDGRNGTNDVYGAASNSGPWTNVPVATGAGSQSAPVVATEAAGTVLHFAWVDDAGTDANIRYASSNGMPGSPLAGTNIVDDTSGADQTAPSIAVAGSTGDNLRVFLCWTDERNASASGRDTDLYFVDVSAGQRTNVLVGDGGTGSDQSEPAVGVDRYGHPYVLWTDSRNVTKYVYYAGSTYMAPDLLESELVTASTGRTVGVATPTSLDDVSVVIPAGACPYDVTINIARLLNPQSILSSNVLAFDFGPSGLQFSQPVTVTIPYPAADYSGGTPVPCWYVSQTGTLSQQDITNIQVLDLSDTLKALRFRTTHFTPYYLLESFVDEDGDGTWDGDDGGGGSDGGGGGGCALSLGGGSAAEFVLPYLGLAAAVIAWRLRDRRARHMQGR